MLTPAKKRISILVKELLLHPYDAGSRMRSILALV